MSDHPEIIAREVIVRDYAKGLKPALDKLREDNPPGPHEQSLIEYLRRFSGGPHEAAMVDTYRNCRPQSDRAMKIIDAASVAEGLSRDEFVARETLVVLRKLAKRLGLTEPAPVATGSAASATGEPGANKGGRPPIPDDEALAMLKAFEESALTQADFARERKLHPAKVSRWLSHAKGVAKTLQKPPDENGRQ